MSDRSSANDLFNIVKKIVDNYINNRKPAAVLIGTYDGSSIVINERLLLPMAMVSGNMKGLLKAGDKIRLLRNDGGGEYVILEIIGRRYALEEEVVR